MSLKLIKYLNWYPFLIVKIGHSGGFGVMRKLTITISTIISLALTISEIISLETRSLQNFTTVMLRYSSTLPALMVFWYVWKNFCRCRMSDVFSSSSRSQQLSLGPQGWFIILWNIFPLVIKVLWLTCYELYTDVPIKALWYTVSTIAWLGISSCIGQLSFEKFFLVRQLRLVKKENVTKQLPCLRLLIDLNSHVNEFHSLMVTVYCLTISCVLLKGMATAWLIFRFFKERHKLLMLTAVYPWHCIQILLMAHGCSSVCDELCDIQWELQRQASQDISSTCHRKQIHTVIEELSHTEGEFSAHGFFTVNLTSVTAAIGFYINIMFIFIQFMQE